MEGLYFHCSLSVCVCVCVSVSEQNSSRTGASIWTRFSLNICLFNWLKPFCWKSRSQWRNIHFFIIILCLTSLLRISTLLCSIGMKFGMSLKYALGRFAFKLHEIGLSDDVIVKSFTFSPHNCQYLNFYWTYIRHTWYQHTAALGTSIRPTLKEAQWRSQV